MPLFTQLLCKLQKVATRTSAAYVTKTARLQVHLQFSTISKAASTSDLFIQGLCAAAEFFGF